MSDDFTREQDEHPRAQREAPSSERASAALADTEQKVTANSTVYPASLLGDRQLYGRGNEPVRTSMIQMMQQTYGNRAVQRYLRNSSSSQTISRKAPSISVQRQPATSTDSASATSEGGIVDTLMGYGEAMLGEVSSWAGNLFGGSTPGTDSGGATGQEEPGKAALEKAIAAGIHDETKLTDLVFHARHPELGGQPIGKDQTELIQEWKTIRETEVKPALAKPTAPGLAPGGQPGKTQPGGEAGGGTPAEGGAKPGAGADDISISFGSDANQSAVTDYSIGVLKDVLRAAGLKSAMISSTARSVSDQARAMYNNLVGTGPGQGVEAQKGLYSSYGDKVIDTFVASRDAGKSPDEIKADMEAKIIELGPTNVSRHCGDFNKLNVFDVAPSSIGAGHGDEKAQTAFINAANAEVGGRVSKFIAYPGDPGHHFEIVPK